jgi:hypothetical protein
MFECGGAPVAGLVCAAQFSGDGCWYRAEVSHTQGEYAAMLFVDYGNAEWVHMAR